MLRNRMRGLAPRKALVAVALAAMALVGGLALSAEARGRRPTGATTAEPKAPPVSRHVGPVSARLNAGVQSTLGRRPLSPGLVGINTRLAPGVISSLNPQPLPPRVANINSRLNPGVLSSLNPQPLPPRVASSDVTTLAR